MDHVQHTITLKTASKEHKQDLEKAAETVEKKINEHHNIKGVKVPWWHYTVGKDKHDFDWEHQRKIEKASFAFAKDKKQPDPEITFVKDKITYKFEFEDQEHGKLIDTDKKRKGIQPLKVVREFCDHSKVDDKLPQSVLGNDD